MEFGCGWERRHLSVVEDGQLIDIISIGDVVKCCDSKSNSNPRRCATTSAALGRLHSTRLRTIGELQSPVRLIPVFHNGHGGALGALVSSAHLPVLIKIAAVYIRIPDFSQPQIYPILQGCWIPASSYNTAKDGEILEETLRFHHITIRVASYGGTVRDACSRLRRGRGHRRRKH
jgi:hypothetical protein